MVTFVGFSIFVLFFGWGIKLISFTSLFLRNDLGVSRAVELLPVEFTCNFS
jgi:hypothetical protein